MNSKTQKRNISEKELGTLVLRILVSVESIINFIKSSTKDILKEPNNLENNYDIIIYESLTVWLYLLTLYYMSDDKTDLISRTFIHINNHINSLKNELKDFQIKKTLVNINLKAITELLIKRTNQYRNYKLFPNNKDDSFNNTLFWEYAKNISIILYDTPHVVFMGGFISVIVNHYLNIDFKNATNKELLIEEYNTQGIAKSQIKDYPMAIEEFNKALELDPKQPDIYFNLGLAKAKQQDFLEAIKDYTKAIEINPKFTEAYNNRGLAKKNIEDYRGAIDDYTKAIELNPNDTTAYKNRAFAHFLIKDTISALSDLTKAGELGDKESYTFVKELQDELRKGK